MIAFCAETSFHYYSCVSAADVKVFSFNLILSMDFLMKLSSFLQPEGNLPQSSAEVEVKEVEVARRRKSSVSGVQGAQQQAEKTVTLALHIEEYDVILVEKMDDINCLALILNVSLLRNSMAYSIEFLLLFNRTKSQLKFVCMVKNSLSRVKLRTSVCI
jgi:vacuolar protein sorting-associated protein 13A/C